MAQAATGTPRQICYNEGHITGYLLSSGASVVAPLPPADSSAVDCTIDTFLCSRVNLSTFASSGCTFFFGAAFVGVFSGCGTQFGTSRRLFMTMPSLFFSAGSAGLNRRSRPMPFVLRGGGPRWRLREENGTAADRKSGQIWAASPSGRCGNGRHRFCCQ